MNKSHRTNSSPATPAAHPHRDRHPTRRDFLGAAAKTAVLIGFPTIIPARVLGLDGGTPPGDKVAVGLIGCGNIAKGQAHYGDQASAVAAVCDVRPERRAEFKAKYGNCADHIDLRELLARDDIDAVHVSTPDHWHIAMGVMAAEAGKHMNIEKPLSLSVDGLLALDKALAGKKLVFQFGTENRANPRAHKFVDLIANGLLGTIQQAIVWNPAGGGGKLANLPEQPVPAGLDWDLWLGPAPARPFTEWRLGPGAIWNIHDYSLGMMANWGIHQINILQWWADVAGLGVPVAVRGDIQMNPDPGYDNVTTYEAEIEYANGFKAQFMSAEIAKKKGVPGFVDDKPYPKHGVTFIGEKGWLRWDQISGLECSFASYEDLMRQKIEARTVAVRPAKGGLNQDFVNAIKTGEPAVADWPSTLRSDLIPVLVDLAGRTQSEVRWDAAKLQVTSPASAQAHRRREMREPWGSIVYQWLDRV